MEAIGAVPNAHILNTILGQAAFVLKLDLVHYVLQKFDIYFVLPTAYTFTTLDRFTKDYRRALVAVEQENKRAMAEFNNYQITILKRNIDNDNWIVFIRFYEEWRRDNHGNARRPTAEGQKVRKFLPRSGGHLEGRSGGRSGGRKPERKPETTQ